MNTAVKTEFLNLLRTRIDRILLVKDPSNTITTGNPVSVYSSLIIDTGTSGKTLIWSGVSGSGTDRFIGTQNSATNSPINFNIPQNDVPNKLVLFQNGDNIVNVIIPITTPSYSDGDGAYFLRFLGFTI